MADYEHAIIISQNTVTLDTIRTPLKVKFNCCWTLKILSTQTTAKPFESRVRQLVTFQCRIGTETLLTFIANIRLHTFMSPYVCLKDTFEAELLLTNVTSEPSSFIVWLQQMWLKCILASETLWTVSTRVWLCTSVNTGMLLYLVSCLEQFSTVRTVIRFPVTVDTFMWMQVAGMSETFVTQWTLERFVSSVDSHVSI